MMPKADDPLKKWVEFYTLELGWSVLPIRPFSKVPAVKSWREFKQRPVTMEDWEYFWKLPINWRDAGLALVLGPHSGVMALDADDKETAQMLLANTPEEAPAVATKRGVKVLFRFESHDALGFDRPCQSYTFTWRDRKLELLHTGLCQLPPSWHPDGIRYQWIRPPRPEKALPDLPWEFRVEIYACAVGQRILSCEVDGWFRESSFKPRAKGFNVEDLEREVMRLLDNLGIWVVREIPYGDGLKIWRLSKCPLCGKSEGAPYLLWPYFRLYDFRAHKCPASKERGGMPYREWKRLALQEVSG